LYPDPNPYKMNTVPQPGIFYLKLTTSSNGGCRFYVRSIHPVVHNDTVELYVYSNPERPERGGPCRLLKLRPMGTLGVHVKEALPWLVHWALQAITKDICLGCSSQPSTKYIIFRTAHFFTLLVPNAQQAGQSVVLGRLSLCLWSNPCLIYPYFARTIRAGTKFEGY
jgi:hypothetical protein